MVNQLKAEFIPGRARLGNGIDSVFLAIMEDASCKMLPQPEIALKTEAVKFYSEKQDFRLLTANNIEDQ